MLKNDIKKDQSTSHDNLFGQQNWKVTKDLKKHENPIRLRSRTTFEGPNQ